MPYPYQLRKFEKIIRQIKKAAEGIKPLSNSALRAKTFFFKQELAQGKLLDDILPEAFALVREVIFRQLGFYLYDVQLLGGIVLHRGQVAEMKTGEGKTLTALLPLYLRALTGKRTFLVTPNAYLASRDAEEAAGIFNCLGMSLGLAVWSKQNPPSVEEKRRVYQSDIVYTTSSHLGFDYLIDNLADNKEKKFFPELNYAIIDEADTVLLDMVQTPLIISGSPRVQSNLYHMADQFVKTLDEQAVFHQSSQREVWLTEQGVKEAESFFRIEHLYDPKHFELVKHLMLALKAHYIYHRQKDYLVVDDEIRLIDQQNGRLLPGTKLQGGLHQAIEVKEGLKASSELRTIATITYQNLFLLFDQLAGMTGTAQTARREFQEVYGMAVLPIATHRPIQRQDLPDLIYPTLTAKMLAVLHLVKDCHQKEQPVLLVTASLTMSQLYSSLLLKEGISHTLLNAQSAGREAEIIARAGQRGAVTIATQMAGRGTDIKLGEGVADLGGLAVIATERFSNQRIDLQIRGRAGRQGDPGFSQFFLSLEDDLLLEYGESQRLERLKQAKRQQSGPLKGRVYQVLVKKAQAKSEGISQRQRESSLSFDKSIKLQRNLVYGERNALLAEKGVELDLEALVKQVLRRSLQSSTMSRQELERYVLDRISYRFQAFPPDLQLANYESVLAYLGQLIHQIIEEKRQSLAGDFPIFLRLASLKALDEAWTEQVDYLQQLRLVLGGLTANQTNPLFDYHQQAHQAYQTMQYRVQENLLRYLCLSDVEKTREGSLRIYFG